MAMRKFGPIVFMLCCLSVSAWAQEVADVVKAYARGKTIVVEYDLKADADFVRLFVSLDGGNTYRGPLQQVSGDVANVGAGFGHVMVWDVLKEFESDEFESDAVRFKLGIKLKERWPRETFVTVNAAYSFLPQASFGFSVGQVKRFGWFVSVMTNGNFSGFDADGDCDRDGFIEGNFMPYYTGETSKMRLSAMAGGLMKVSDYLCLRLGLGYGNSTLLWHTEDGRWLRNTAYSAAGLDLSAGVQLHLNGFVVSAEAVTTQFQTVEAKIGIGYAF